MADLFLVLGEALVDIVHRDGATTESVGGSPANLAVALARLGNSVELATGLGSDRRGSMVAEHLRSAGVHLAADPYVLSRTSTAVATLDVDGVATYEFDVRGALPRLGSSPSRRHLHTGSIGAILEPGCDVVVQAIDDHRTTATISYDINARPAVTGGGSQLARRVEKVAKRCDLVKASDEDLAAVYPGLSPEQAARHLLLMGPAAVVVTRGAAGASCFTVDHEVSVPGVPVAVADSIAAGDTFCAGVLDGLAGAGCLGAAGRTHLASASPELWRGVLVQAATASAITVSRPGADPPTRGELDALLESTTPC